ncbi:DUF986 family protein, partial [Providencia rettgeri]
ILIIGLEKKKINIQVSHLDDLQRIYEFLINHK